MTRDKAREVAQHSATRNGEPYYAIQAKNGQWMVERAAFVDNAPRGRLIYSPTRPRERFAP